jgi:hypothetical protein
MSGTLSGGFFNAIRAFRNCITPMGDADKQTKLCRELRAISKKIELGQAVLDSLKTEIDGCREFFTDSSQNTHFHLSKFEPMYDGFQAEITTANAEGETVVVPFTFGRGAYRCPQLFFNNANRSPVDMAKETGVSCDYFSALEDVAQLIVADDRASDRASLDIWRQYAVEMLESGIRSVRDAAILAKAWEVKDQPERAELLRRRDRLIFDRWVVEACRGASYPLPPPAKTAAKNVTKKVSASGVYFAWDGPTCLYVGKSVNIGNRIPHDHVAEEDDVSWLEMGHEDMHHAELFYIGILRPVRNRVGQQKATRRDELAAV